MFQNSCRKVCMIVQKPANLHMLNKKENPAQLGLYSSFEEQLNHEHSLYILANAFNWQIFEDEFKKYYSEDMGCPGKPIRLMVGLLMLKPVRDLSDESVVEQWAVKGDEINVLLACSAMNFKRMMNKWKREAKLFVNLFFTLNECPS